MHAVVEEELVRLATDDDHGPEVRPRHLRPHRCLRQRDSGPHSGGDGSRDVVHRRPAVELQSGSLLRQPRSQLPEEQLRVDGRPVIPLRERGDERRRGTRDDTDAERNDAVRLRGQRPLDRLVDYRRGSKDVRGDKDPRQSAAGARAASRIPAGPPTRPPPGSARRPARRRSSLRPESPPAALPLPERTRAHRRPRGRPGWREGAKRVSRREHRKDPRIVCDDSVDTVARRASRPASGRRRSRRRRRRRAHGPLRSQPWTRSSSEASPRPPWRGRAEAGKRRGRDVPIELSAARTSGASGPRLEIPKRSRGKV